MSEIFNAEVRMGTLFVIAIVVLPLACAVVSNLYERIREVERSIEVGLGKARLDISYNIANESRLGRERNAMLAERVDALEERVEDLELPTWAKEVNEQHPDYQVIRKEQA